METHRLDGELLRRTVEVLVVGCGGNGSTIATGLPYLHNAMLAQGHPYGLHVTVVDGDTVLPFNSARQPFVRSEIGLNKAIALVNRINLFWGLDWTAVPRALTEETLRPDYGRYNDRYLRPDIVIGCVDTRAARAVIAKAISGPSLTRYLMDIGNGASSGQFVLGEPLNSRNKRSRLRLRVAYELYPEFLSMTTASRVAALSRLFQGRNPLLTACYRNCIGIACPPVPLWGDRLSGGRSSMSGRLVRCPYP